MLRGAIKNGDAEQVLQLIQVGANVLESDSSVHVYVIACGASSASVRACEPAHMRAWVCVRVRARVCVCIYTYIYIYMYIHQYAYTYLHIHMHMHIHAQTHELTHPDPLILQYVNTCTHKHELIRTHTRSFVHDMHATMPSLAPLR